ncbi:MAG TPA: hypothetical protein VHQ86_00365 [Candidatus Saccharimonadia bacterium]|jgi:hypothetical protein|nr:hypothetical protein [Candidatus Saccharimonadia bacterium]
MLVHIISSVVHFLIAASPAASSAPSGAGAAIINGAGQACGSNCGSGDFAGLLKSAANVLTFLVGSVSVLMIIYGGFRYVISRGDSSQIKVAKDTILYAVVGVIVAIVAFAIVNFVATVIK